MKKVCLLLDYIQGKLTSNSIKLISMAQRLKKVHGYEICVLLFGIELADTNSILEKIEIDMVWFFRQANELFVDHSELEALVAMLHELQPDIVWGCSNHQNSILFPKIANLLKTGLCATCMDYKYVTTAERIDMVRLALGGNVMAQISVHKTKPLMATISDDREEYSIYRCQGNPIIVDKTPKPYEKQITNIRIKMLQQTLSSDNLVTSKVVIGLGNGIHHKSEIPTFEKLSTMLNATIGGSRALIEKHWLSREYQIGMTGVSISPDIYIAFGISGSPQHIKGIEQAKFVIAINHDPYAAIFQYADYGIVGDVLEVAEFMIKYLEKKV